MSNLRDHAGEAEQALIGSALVQPSCLAALDITPGDFVNENNREVWAAILQVDQSGPVDLVTVSHHLKASTGRDWVVYLSQCAQATPSASNAVSYGDALRDVRQKIVAQEAAQELLGAIQKQGMAAVDHAIGVLMELGKAGKRYDFTLKESMREAVNHMEAVRKGEIHTISTGLSDLDEKLGGLHRSDLVVLGARPAMGKTAVMLNMALGADAPVGIISSEQPHMQVGYRCMAIGAGVGMGRLRASMINEAEDAKLWAAVSRMADSQVYINDQSGISITQLVRQARRWKHAHDIQVLYVDYIQRIKAADPTAKRHEQVGEVVRGLKELARELDIPVVALAQVGRQVEQRSDRRPHMGDLSDSSEIEKESDQVMMLYRDEVYNEHTDMKGIIEFIIDKNRHGPTGNIRACWMGETLQVRNLARPGP